MNAVLTVRDLSALRLLCVLEDMDSGYKLYTVARSQQILSNTLGAKKSERRLELTLISPARAADFSAFEGCEAAFSTNGGQWSLSFKGCSNPHHWRSSGKASLPPMRAH